MFFNANLNSWFLFSNEILFIRDIPISLAMSILTPSGNFVRSFPILEKNIESVHFLQYAVDFTQFLNVKSTYLRFRLKRDNRMSS